MIKPPRTAVLAAVVATTIACKGRSTGPGPDAVGTVATPQQPPIEDQDVGTVAAPEEKVGIVASPNDDQRRRRAEPPATDPVR